MRLDNLDRFTQLWDECSVPVLRYVSRRVPAPDVDDVVADTFVVAWRRLEDVPDPALPWLLGVARGVASNSARSANRQVSLMARLVAQPHPLGSDSQASPAGSFDPVETAFARLPEGDRELLSLIAWEGLSAGEVAEAVGCSVGAFRVRLHRARIRFRAAYAQIQTDHEPRGSIDEGSPAASVD